MTGALIGKLTRRVAGMLMTIIVCMSPPVAASIIGTAETGIGAVDAAIVFAVDRSSSIGRAEARLQREGHADALRSPEVAGAIANGVIGCIGVTYVEWSSAGTLNIVLPWTKLCTPDDAAAISARILARGNDGSDRRSSARTSLSFALEMSSFFLDRFPGRAARKIIDISSNGTNNDGLPVAQSRMRVLNKRHIINCIAISRDEPGVTDDLPGYYAENVAGGPGSFVIVPSRPRDYVAAIRKKLVLEISGAPASRDQYAMAFTLLSGSSR